MENSGLYELVCACCFLFIAFLGTQPPPGALLFLGSLSFSGFSVFFPDIHPEAKCFLSYLGVYLLQPRPKMKEQEEPAVGLSFIHSFDSVLQALDQVPGMHCDKVQLLPSGGLQARGGKLPMRRRQPLSVWSGRWKLETVEHVRLEGPAGGGLIYEPEACEREQVDRSRRHQWPRKWARNRAPQYYNDSSVPGWPHISFHLKTQKQHVGILLG